GGIERQIVIDELPEVRVERGNAALLVILSVLGRVRRPLHRFRQLRENGLVIWIRRSKRRRGTSPKHSPEPSLENRRSRGSNEPADRYGMLHNIPPIHTPTGCVGVLYSQNV